MIYKNIILVFSLLMVAACGPRGKSCMQMYHDTVSFENRTNRDLILEIVDFNSEYTLEIKSQEIGKQKLLKEYLVKHEGTWSKGGMPQNASCEDQPYVVGISAWLKESSFNEVKHCYDNDHNTSIFIEKTDACPADTFEQKKPGIPQYESD